MDKLRNKEFVKIAVMLAIIVVGTLGFMFGLKAVLRIDYPLMVVVSESMVPTLNVGDIIVVKGELNASAIKASTPESSSGDIVVFHKPGEPSNFIVHRVINKTFKGDIWYFETKGDNNPYSDYWPGFPEGIPQNNIIGKVMGRIPLFGYLFLFLRTPFGLIMFITLILVFTFQEYIFLQKDGEADSEQVKSLRNASSGHTSEYTWSEIG